jgi:hypothetical protein
MFASTVGFIGAFHLLSTTVERLGKGRNNREKRQVTREDWYCFFQPSDLLGTDATCSTDTPQPTITDDQQLEQRRRQQANRPRLQA